MGSLFSGSSVEECVEKASKAFNVSSEKLKYKITKDEKHFFKRKVEIEALVEKEEFFWINKWRISIKKWRNKRENKKSYK